MEHAASALAQTLLDQKKMLACAESCTGGLVAKLCTDLPGSSAWFDRGFITYSNQAKQEMLGVSAACIATHGAVSVEVVQAMAKGALQHSQADVALAVSGVAGPGGGSAEKPVGLVCFGFASRTNVQLITQQFAGDRETVRQLSADFALHTMLDFIQDTVGSPTVKGAEPGL